MYDGGITYALDNTRVTTLFLHTASPLDVLTGASLTPAELTRFAVSVRQGPNVASVRLSWHDELYGANQPRPGQVLEIRLEGESYWIGIIEEINDYRLKSGEAKGITIVARSRDGTPAWRNTRRATDVYPTATPLAYIAKQIVQSVGLTGVEILLPDAGASTVHSNTQLADLTPWQMLTLLYQPGGLEPYIDCRGRVKCISRDIGRVPDITFTDNRRLIEVSGSKARPSLTEMRIRWLDPKLSESAQQDRMLDRATITAGFFQLKQHRDVRFSQDGTQRARDTHLVIKQSANSGLLSFCSENYEQHSTTTGLITLTTSIFAPALATLALGELITAAYIPDWVQTDVVTGTGQTIPVGRPVQATAEVALMLIMMCLGTGQYEIWGTPFDYVHARNTTTAFNLSASVWEINPQEIENDFVMNEAQAQSFAIRELIYLHRSASPFNLQIVDDTRIERGDIIELSDGARVYVTDYSRDLTFGAPAVLEIQGFVANVNASVGAARVIDPVYYPPTTSLIFPAPPPGNPLPIFPTPITPPPPAPAPGPPPPPPVPTIYIPDVPIPESKVFILRFWMNRRIGNPGVIDITDTSIGGGASISPPAGKGPDDFYLYISDTDVLTAAYYRDEPPASGNAFSSGTVAFTQAEFAFSHVGRWSGALRPSDSPEAMYLGYSGLLRDISSYVIHVIDGSDGPICWDLEAQNIGVCHVVRQQPAWGNNASRTFDIKTGGIYFWRLNVLEVQAQRDTPNAPLWPWTLGTLQMYDTIGGDPLCFGGFGDCDDAYIGGADAVFGGGGFSGYKTNPGNGTEQWLRYGFAAPTNVIQYGMRATQGGLAPRSWSFEASVNGVNWTIVDFQQNIVWQDNEAKYFTLPNPVVFGDPP